MIKADVYTTLRKQMIIQFYFLYKKFEKISTSVWTEMKIQYLKIWVWAMYQF